MNLRKPKWRVIYEQEAERHRVTVRAMLEASRRHEIVLARRAAWDRINRELGWTLPRIAIKARRHWSTIHHGLNVVRGMAEHG